MKRFQLSIINLIIALSTFAVTPSFAGNANGGGKMNDGASLPVNKGIVILLIAGFIIGIYVLKTSRKKAQSK